MDGQARFFSEMAQAIRRKAKIIVGDFVQAPNMGCGENEIATRAQYARDFVNRSLRIGYVFQDLIAQYGIASAIAEGEVQHIAPYVGAFISSASFFQADVLLHAIFKNADIRLVATPRIQQFSIREFLHFVHCLAHDAVNQPVFAK